MTRETSRVRGATLKTKADNTKLIPRLPRSIALDNAPVKDIGQGRSTIINLFALDKEGKHNLNSNYLGEE